MNLTITLTPTAPNHGDTLTATYAVTGEPVVAPVTVTGTAVVDGQTLSATATTTFGNVEKFNPPTATGLTFTQSSTNPHVWTALIP